MPIGSYNPSESLLGMSPSPSRRGITGLDYSEAATSMLLGITVSLKTAASFPGNSGEMMMAVKNDENALVKSSTNKTLAEKLHGVAGM